MLETLPFFAILTSAVLSLPTTNRKLGPVLGKVVAVVGQGQNGLIATRLMSQFAAKAVIAIDPVRHLQLQHPARHSIRSESS